MRHIVKSNQYAMGDEMATKTLGKYSVTRDGDKSVDNRTTSEQTIPVNKTTYAKLADYCKRNNVDADNARGKSRDGVLPHTVLMFDTWLIIASANPVEIRDIVGERGAHITRDDGRQSFTVYAKPHEIAQIAAYMTTLKMPADCVTNPRDIAKQKRDVKTQTK
jgi:hypothetical protein